MKYILTENKKENSLTFLSEEQYTPEYIASCENEGCEVIKTFEANDYNEAMQKYYDYMDWGVYKPF
jgi:hypothetical protein